MCVQFLIVEIDRGAIEGIFKPIPAHQPIDVKAAIGGCRISADKRNLGRGAERDCAGAAVADAVAICPDIACGRTDMDVPSHDIEPGNILSKLESAKILAELRRTIADPTWIARPEIEVDCRVSFEIHLAADTT